MAEILAPTESEKQRLIRARRAAQIMTRLGREAGSMGGMPFEKRVKGRSAYRAAEPVASVVMEKVVRSPLYGLLVEAYPLVGAAGAL
jgi:hypothetical protein